MAAANISAVLSPPAHPMAASGYGKRHAPDQAPPRAADFAGLEPREAAIAAYIDRLPEGAAIGYKVLAEELPEYGQQACRSALDRLTRAGHLRRIRVHVTVPAGGKRWVTRTYFSRTVRDADWWARFVRFVRGLDAPGQPPAPAPAPASGSPAASASAPAPALDAVPATGGPSPDGTPGEPEPEPGVPAARSEAYRVLAGLGAREPRLQLSEGECVALEHLVGEWLTRGVGRERITQTLTAGLPPAVHAAGPFLRTRLENKMPPAPAPQQPYDSEGAGSAGPGEQVLDCVMVCLFCDEDETTANLEHGVCPACRADIDRDEANGMTGDVPDTFLARPRGEVDVAARMAELRSATARPVLPAPRPRR
ncbi:hypothetical protein EES43_12875 [Streptomyces sp. ADI96-02]|uniref:hypothetical protein n=1 Tax=Streptomyces sp. ADI96-02 TaxID=1522760 RepID=UPI000FA9CCA9|nr:hypothetical protein [Streptomyces sp. ADI96-02]RPK62881.1 hypothetical protein EES43_12875 [Streptomyces sp. ADI96-02]